MADTNTLDLSDLSSEPVESNVQAEISDAPADVEEPVEVDEEPVSTEEPEEVAEEPVDTEAPVEAEEPSAPSTEEVVETVQTILTSDAPATNVATKTEERLNTLIELLKSTSEEYEYDDNKYRWTGPLINIREALNEL